MKSKKLKTQKNFKKKIFGWGEGRKRERGGRRKDGEKGYGWGRGSEMVGKGWGGDVKGVGESFHLPLL